MKPLHSTSIASNDFGSFPNGCCVLFTLIIVHDCLTAYNFCTFSVGQHLVWRFLVTILLTWTRAASLSERQPDSEFTIAVEPSEQLNFQHNVSPWTHEIFGKCHRLLPFWIHFCALTKQSALLLLIHSFFSPLQISIARTFTPLAAVAACLFLFGWYWLCIFISLHFVSSFCQNLRCNQYSNKSTVATSTCVFFLFFLNWFGI